MDKEIKELIENVAYGLADHNDAIEAIEQYVIKAKIEKLESIRKQQIDGGYCIDEDIAELQKGLKP